MVLQLARAEAASMNCEPPSVGAHAALYNYTGQPSGPSGLSAVNGSPVRALEQETASMSNRSKHRTRVQGQQA